MKKPSFIVTDAQGRTREDYHVIHHTREEACEYGCRVYGKGRFLVKSYSYVMHTQRGKAVAQFNSNLLATRDRFKKHIREKMQAILAERRFLPSLQNAAQKLKADTALREKIRNQKLHHTTI